ncbi:methylenetetrahydrofolate reductase [Phosphitispora sp. TUW77]|uniref:methylenetetrahydrofolate reductase n=1 Tax=Phosphitispora sp. TUW77 TaxID=3152361 RepID=UPI003AB78A2E
MGLKDKLGKQFVITTELGPADGTDVRTALEKARSYIKLDAINIHDCPMARLRINSIALAHIVQSELGIDTIPHFTCRDRSLLGTQADILGAAALGIRFLLPTTGDPPHHGPFQSKAVYDLNTISLISLIKEMNKGLDANGKEFKGPTNFMISGTTSAVGANMDAVYSRAKRKVEAGVDFFQTQPCYDVEKTIAFAEKMKQFGKPVIIGLMPLKTIKMAEYMNASVDGIEIPDEVLSKIREGVSGAAVACEFVAKVYKHIDGIHIMALGDVKASNEIIEHTLSLIS